MPIDEPCCLSVPDIQQLLELLRNLTPEKRATLNLQWPATLMSTEEFTTLVQNEMKAKNEYEALEGSINATPFLILDEETFLHVKTLKETLTTFRSEKQRLSESIFPWVNSALHDIFGGNSLIWQRLLENTQSAGDLHEDVVLEADRLRIEYPEKCDFITLYDDAITLKTHLEDGRALGWGIFRPKIVKERLYVIKSIKIEGRFCHNIAQFSSLIDALNVRIECEKAWSYWHNHIEKNSGPYSLQVSSLKSLCDTLKRALNLKKYITKCRDLIQNHLSIDEPTWTNDTQIEQTINFCQYHMAQFRKKIVSTKIGELEKKVSETAIQNTAHPITNDILSAIRERDSQQYAACLLTIQSLNKSLSISKKIEMALSDLRQITPRLTERLETSSSETFWVEKINQINEAWQWAQAKFWIEKLIRKEEVPLISQRAKQIEDKINFSIAQLASIHAWTFCFRRLKEEHRRHMEAWQQSMRRLGKGTGKHAHRHRRDAQEHLDKCREAVPAWVMPLHRVWDTVAPAPGIFDVIIVDEASQCGLEGIPLFYYGKKILIVGDDKQISPEAVGLPRDTVNKLRNEFLFDYNFKSTFDVESSLFDHAKLRYGTQQIILREHFRCMPEIIRFSNDLCYSDTPLIPLRQYGPNRLQPLEHVFVSNGYREGSNSRIINRPEADAIVSKIVQYCGDSQYDGMSFGVIVLQGDAQATLIEDQLLKHLGAEEMQKRRLLCGNPYSFQGDERDIIFISLVVANNERIGTLTKASDERRFNVAASRARNKMILFHSIKSEDLGSVCLRRRFIDFFMNTEPQTITGIKYEDLERSAFIENRRLMRPPNPFDSWFEVDVALELIRKKYIVLPQFEIAGKRIDLVIAGGHARLAVECDGDYWHGSDQYEADMQRQRLLERCGWEFYRIRESTFYANKDFALERLWQILCERGISPE